jgi:hypothetical protein
LNPNPVNAICSDRFHRAIVCFAPALPSRR